MKEISLEPRRTDLMHIPFRLLRLAPGNSRFDMGKIDEQTESIRVNGILQPMRGYKGKEDGIDVYFVVDGSRRFESCRRLYELGIEIVVPFRLQPKNTNEEQSTIERIISNEGKPYNSFELALEVRKLSDWGWEVKTIAAKIAKGESYIRKLLSLSHAPMALQNLIREGKIKGSLAITAIEKGLVDKVIAELAETPAPTPTEDGEEPDDEGLLEQIALFPPNSIGATAGKAPVKVPAAPAKEPTPPRTTITRSQLVTNSWRSFKDYAKMADPAKMNPDAQRTFQFLTKVMNNEVNESDIAAFFLSTAKDGE